MRINGEDKWFAGGTETVIEVDIGGRKGRYLYSGLNGLRGEYFLWGKGMA